MNVTEHAQQQPPLKQPRLSGSLSPIISPSILAADAADLAADVARAAEGGADWIHVDMFDGTFAPNFTFGIPVVASLRKHTKLFLDCHLAVDVSCRDMLAHMHYHV